MKKITFKQTEADEWKVGIYADLTAIDLHAMEDALKQAKQDGWSKDNLVHVLQMHTLSMRTSLKHLFDAIHVDDITMEHLNSEESVDHQDV